ncbi:hypothetical protein Vi05172_g6771 [Venturia inaequalis]|nr:hypothetical protein Vi05172_g6771 [Venturia inaequalis]
MKPLFFLLTSLQLTTAWMSARPTIKDAAPARPVPPELLRHIKFGIPKIPEMPLPRSKLSSHPLLGPDLQHQTPAKLSREL